MSLDSIEIKKNKIIHLIDEVIDEILKEIEGEKEGFLHEIKEISYIYSVLNDLRTILKLERFDVIKKTELNVARIVIDTWDLDDVVGNKICQIEYDFNRLKLCKI